MTRGPKKFLGIEEISLLIYLFQTKYAENSSNVIVHKPLIFAIDAIWFFDIVNRVLGF